MNDADSLIARAAESIRNATALIVTAGAGMGVDCGLPDFRGPEGFWAAYPPYRALGLGFRQLATPATFRSDPSLAWGFYGHRLALYRATAPHEGYSILARWAARMADGYFVFTSNVDGHFARAGFDSQRIVECHGSIHHVQCTTDCEAGIRSAQGLAVPVHPATMRAATTPRCPSCGNVSRPNILLFNDAGWDAGRSEAQQAGLATWLREASWATGRIVILECGAGTEIASVRDFGERAARLLPATLIRINPREAEVAAPGFGIPSGALEALRAIDARLGGGT
jgi:NAD-dependent SIR2 family protein deacetylase